MKFRQSIPLTALAMLTLSGPAIAQDNIDNALAGVRLGFAADRGFGVIATVKQFNIFVGNDGAAVDYIFRKETLKTDLKGPAFWYVGAGVYGDWDSDRGLRLPVGAEWHFAKQLDAFAQIMPYLRVNNDTHFGLDGAIGVRYQF